MIENRFMRIVTLACAASLAGCAAGPSTIVPFEGDNGVAAIQFADIPVPDGMHLKTHSYESHSYEVGDFRYGDFEYFGPVRPGAAVRYMRERMSVHGWELAREAMEQDTNVLEFQRRPYRAECRVWKDNARTRMTVTVRTEVERASDSGVESDG